MVTRSSGVAANFLCDNTKYMLGLIKAELMQGCRSAFRQRRKTFSVVKDVDEPMANAICNFLIYGIQRRLMIMHV